MDRRPGIGEFVTEAGLADAFTGNCPATFRAEYLPGGPGYVSDHVGLRASPVLTPPAVTESAIPG